MRFGLATLFAFRPHVQHMAYLMSLLKSAGHDVCGFTCDAAVDHCYSRDLRARTKVRECPACILGGIRSFPVPDIWPIDPHQRETLDSDRLRALTVSSVATVMRTEAAEDLKLPGFVAAQRALEAPVETVYSNAKKWIQKKRLDAVLVFNGRMDLTAALCAACEDLQIPFVSVERSWLGHGLQLRPNQNCLGLREINRLSVGFRDLPLNAEQARYAGRVAADRFLQRNFLEWRLYNSGATYSSWPTATARGARVLILPSSRNEFEGHGDFACGWHEFTAAVDAVLAHLDLAAQGCVVRCHPNWSERIGRNTGWRSEKHWTDWAVNRGVTVVPSSEKVSTYGLIGEADYVIVSTSSSGVEAGLRGRKVICVGHSFYEAGGFSIQVHGPDELHSLAELSAHDPELTSRRALRFLHTHGRRFAQFSKFVRATTTVHYEYYEGAEPERLIRMCQSGVLEPDDPDYGETSEVETEVVEKLIACDWEWLGQWQDIAPSTQRLDVSRRAGLRWVDAVRDRFARGDL